MDRAKRAAAMRAMAFVTSVAIAASACAAIDDGTTDEVVVGDDGGKADGTTETKVRTGDTSVWVRNEIKRETRGDRQVLVVRGRTSRDVTSGYGFVFDDPVGDWAALGARSFEVTYATDEFGLLDGGQHFVSLSFKHSADRPDSLTARVVARAKLGSFTGDGSYLDADVVPVVNAGLTVWRVKGRTSSTIYGVRASVGTVRKTDSKHFEIDLARDDIRALIGTSTKLAVEVDLSNGTHTKNALVSLRLAELGLTSEDAYEVWPQPTCTDEVRTCLAALPDGTVDLAACGEAIEVRVCQGQLGVVFDAAAYAAVWPTVTARTSSTAFRADMTALVGADRLEQYQGLAEQTLEARLEGLYGLWYVDAAARDAAVTAVIEAAFDQIYARPFELLDEPHLPTPNDLDATRQVIADALLQYLASIDLTHTEFNRSLEELAHLFRTRHISDLRAWRETVTPQHALNGRDVYIGNWLDPYVEITVVRATGAVELVHFEID
jgi:hypothetical protein